MFLEINRHNNSLLGETSKYRNDKQIKYLLPKEYNCKKLDRIFGLSYNTSRVYKRLIRDDNNDNLRPKKKKK